MTDFKDIIKNKKRFNGKPFKYWEEKAREQVIAALVRAANTDQRSLTGVIVRSRLLELAKAEDSKLCSRALKDRDRIQTNFVRIMKDLTS